MASEPSTQPSFSPGRRWAAGINVVLGVVAALAIVVGVNFISRNYFSYRAFVSPQTRIQLSPQTLGLVKSITNDVRITLYYDKDDGMFTTISALLNEYHLANRRITVETVDYNKNPTEAQKVKLRYNLAEATDKDLVIFDCGGRVKKVPGAALTEYTMEAVPNEREREFRKRPVAFQGELMFSSLLLAVNNAEPLHAYYLLGHGEHNPEGQEEKTGFARFITLLNQNYIRVDGLTLLDTNTVPADCNVLIIAAPTAAIPEGELAKLSRYLDEGGRALILLNCLSVDKDTGLELLLEKWGVSVSRRIIKDEAATINGQDVVVTQFTRHPVVNPLLGNRLHVLLPRWVSEIVETNAPADAPKVSELAYTTTNSVLLGLTNDSTSYPIAVAVEKGAVKAVATERGTTRLIVVGDSFFLNNQLIDSAANRDFASHAINWLTDRTQLMEGLGPRPVKEFKLMMTRTQMTSARWLLLGGLPGGILLIGSLVWLRRRN
jgi:hypothetical protein